MWTIVSEPIEKQYYASILSRSFLLSALCCIFAFVVPILILVSIGYSWNKYKQILVQPSLTFQHYQASCMMADGETTYDSTFSNEKNLNYKSFINVGFSSNTLDIWGNFIPILNKNIIACSALLYFQVNLNNNVQSLAVLPIQFQNLSPTNLLQSVSEFGMVTVNMVSAIPQSSILSSIFMNYFGNTSQVLTITDSHRSFNLQKNLTLIPKINTQQLKYISGIPKSVSYTSKLQVPSQIYLQQVSLLENLRTFIPYFIYLFILFWIFLTQPTLRWMLENKIYRAKVSHPKLKDM